MTIYTAKNNNKLRKEEKKKTAQLQKGGYIRENWIKKTNEESNQQKTSN